MFSINRRTLLGGLAAGATALVPRSRVFAQAKPSRITVTSYGGIFEGAVRDTFVADFTKRTGVAADIQLGNPNQWMSQVEANPGKPPVDAVISSVDLVIEIGKKNLLEKPTVEKVPNLADIPQYFVDICQGWGVCFDYGSGGIAYHKGRVKNPPKSLRELVDRTAKGEFRASLPTVAFQPALQLLIWSLNDALGGTLDNITPVIDAVKRMKPNTVFWSSVTDFLNHLQSGEADIGLYYDGRVWAAYDSGMTFLDFINPSEGAVMTPIAVVKPTNAPPIAWEYINSMLAPEPQTEFGNRMNFGMTNKKVHYSEKVKDRITPWEKTRLPPVDRMAPYVSQWVERWNKEIGA
jgi:putative spermidine/putrescine transport system substrate-binding protein